MGCEELLLRVYQVEPKYHIFGHIHEDYGSIFKGRTTFINASVLDHWNEMEYSSTPDKVAAYEEDELNCKDGDNLRSTRRANRRYPNAFGIVHLWIGSIWIGDILAEGGRRMPYFPLTFYLIDNLNLLHKLLIKLH